MAVTPNPGNKSPGSNPMYIKQSAAMLKLKLHEVLWAETVGSYMKIHTMNGNFTVHISLEKLQGLMGADKFARANNSFLVALDKISSINRKTLVIQNTLIPISEPCLKTFIPLL